MGAYNSPPLANFMQEITIVNSENSTTLPWVLKFAQLMEAKLAKNRHKGDRAGWLNASPFELLRRLRDEAVEIEEALYHSTSPDEVEKECADVANFAMMIADTFRARCEMNRLAAEVDTVGLG
jgi:NTP pyrophosphatase (non-canonical NTP hydrolase)